MRHVRIRAPAPLVLVFLFLIAAPGSGQDADNWPHWRGPDGTGVSDERDVPLYWSNDEGIAWRARLGGVGLATPIVWGERVFVSSQRGAGARRDGNHPTLVQSGSASEAGERLLAVDRAGADAVAFVIESFGRTGGEPLWRFELPAEGALPPVHDKHNLASPSPATDGERVYAVYGTGQVAAVDAAAGGLAWSRNLADDHGPFDITWGHTSSPVVYGDTLIVPAFHATASYLIALDTRTGETRWRTERGREVLSYSTPLIVSTPAGEELVLNTSEGLEAYRPDTGEPLWRFEQASRFPIPMPVFHDGMIYTSRGYRSGPYLALAAGGRGALDEAQIEWMVPTGAPYVSSLVHVGGLLFMTGDVGVVTCIDAETGERVWQERTGGVFSASPVVAEGRVYMPSETGETIVMRAARTPEILARNTIDGRLLASPAIAGGLLFLRTDDEIVAIEGSAQPQD